METVTICAPKAAILNYRKLINLVASVKFEVLFYVESKNLTGLCVVFWIGNIVLQL